MNLDQVQTARHLWRKGLKLREIAGTIGVKLRGLTIYIHRKPHLFPERKMRCGGRPRNPVAIIAAVEADYPISRPDTMRFTTSTGYVCTMPRVSILEKAG